MDGGGTGTRGAGPEHDAVLNEIAARFPAGDRAPIHTSERCWVYALNSTLAAKVVVFDDDAARAAFAHELDVHARLTAQLPNAVIPLREAHLGGRAGWAVVARFPQTLHASMVAAHTTGGAAGLAHFHAEWWRLIANEITGIVGALRTAGVVHMDLRPDNVAVLASDGGMTLRAFDFGRAAAVMPGGWVVGGCYDVPCDGYDLAFFAHHYNAAYTSIAGAAPVPMQPTLVEPEKLAAVRANFGKMFLWQGM